MRLPTKIVFPFGYVVLIKEISDAEMRLEAGEEDEFPDGLFDPDTRSIFIRKDLPLGRKKYLLSHEVLHAVADWQHDLFNEGALRP